MERETRRVVIEWDDTPGETFETTVVVDGEWVEGEPDDNIFFYFRSVAELEDAKSGGSALDFRVVEVLA
jgi:hypothetical protein